MNCHFRQFVTRIRGPAFNHPSTLKYYRYDLMIDLVNISIWHLNIILFIFTHSHPCVMLLATIFTTNHRLGAFAIYATLDECIR